MDRQGHIDFANRRGRLYWQCRRGMLELDYMLRGFLEASYDCLNTEELETMENLLTYPDPVLLEWLMGRMIPFDKDVASLVERIRYSATA